VSRVPARATQIRGAAAVAHLVQTFMRPGAAVHPALVNGAAGVVISARNRVVAVIGFTVRDAAIVAIVGIADPARLRRIDFSGFGGNPS
jgi:RNA polymerase sigma-70 factor (ECF subfamily)